VIAVIARHKRENLESKAYFKVVQFNLGRLVVFANAVLRSGQPWKGAIPA